MPRPVEEIIAHAGKIDVAAMTQLRAAVAARPAAEGHVVDAIRSTRKASMSWNVIVSFVGTTGEGARQRYARFTA